MPEDLRPQEQVSKEALRAMGIPLLEKDGYEADDTLGMVANYYVSLGYEVMIVTTDKDMAQLVTNEITTYNPSSKQRFTPAGVKEKFGVGPDGIIDYLAIMGDKTDGIIGIDKVGPKTAARWLEQYGSIENVIDNADLIKGKVGDNLRDSLDRLPLNKKLTTIIADPALLTNEEKQNLASPQPSPAEADRISKTYGLNVHPIGGSVAQIDQAQKQDAPQRPASPPKKTRTEPDSAFEQGSLF
jgi:DNA polymerase-1